MEHCILQNHRGKCSPLEFIEELLAMEQAKIRNALRLLQEFGKNLSMPHAKPIQGNFGNYVQEESGYSILPPSSNNSLSCMDIENKARKHLAARLRQHCDVCKN